MKKVLKMSPNVARIADKIVAAAIKARGKCLQRSALSAESKRKFPSSRLKEGLFTVWNVSRDKNNHLSNLIYHRASQPGFVFIYDMLINFSVEYAQN